MPGRFEFPVREYTDPKDFVTPGNPILTAINMEDAYTPNVYWTGSVWINPDKSRRAKDWFKEFL